MNAAVVIKEFFPVVVAAVRGVIKATRKDSPGGKKITKEEVAEVRDAILAKLSDALDDILPRAVREKVVAEDVDNG